MKKCSDGRQSRFKRAVLMKFSSFRKFISVKIRKLEDALTQWMFMG